MTARSHSRGHEIEYQDEWVYSDTKASITTKRTCKWCYKAPTKEGYDACLGYIPGVKSACCGHGVKRKYVY